MATFPDEAKNSGAPESDLPFVLASTVAHLCCDWRTWVAQSAASELALAHSKDLVVPWPAQSPLLVGSATGAEHPPKGDNE